MRSFNSSLIDIIRIEISRSSGVGVGFGLSVGARELKVNELNKLALPDVTLSHIVLLVIKL